MNHSEQSNHNSPEFPTKTECDLPLLVGHYPNQNLMTIYTHLIVLD